MNVAIIGAGGQLGRELARSTPPAHAVTALDRARLDVTRASDVTRVLGALAPGLVINAAGYTAVDRAEEEPDAAAAVNATGAELVARAVRELGARLIHVSTDYVFDGARGTPYRPTDPPNPLSVYGRSKLDGERRVLAACGASAVVIRTAWVYAAHGRNFVRTMLERMREGRELRVVADQIGTPTWTRSVARAIWRAAERAGVSGVHHWTDAGVASWYDLAVAVQEEALAAGLEVRPAPIVPIATRDYPAAARRPSFSVLDRATTEAALELRPDHWRVSLRGAIGELASRVPAPDADARASAGRSTPDRRPRVH